ncbi:hypothetical protein BD309DRAFT_945398 [Dichomitus squalens]|nr:hypothetical protein BD309DRAFT_945398 [Dichomitus squalens]
MKITISWWVRGSNCTGSAVAIERNRIDDSIEHIPIPDRGAAAPATPDLQRLPHQSPCLPPLQATRRGPTRALSSPDGSTTSVGVVLDDCAVRNIVDAVSHARPGPRQAAISTYAPPSDSDVTPW